MTIDRRSLIAVLAAGGGLLAIPFAARAEGTLEEVKKRGTFRVGVTQAPPWFSKDPKTSEWSTGVGIFMGQAMAKTLGAKMETVEVSWGNSIAALQADKIDIMFTIDATPRAQGGGRFSGLPAALLLTRRAGEGRPAGEGVGGPQQAGREDRRAAGLVDGSLCERACAQGRHTALPPTMPPRSPPSSRAASTRCACSIRRCWPRARSSVRASWSCRRRRNRRPRAPRCARATPSSSPGSISSLAEYYKSGQTQKWYEQALTDFGLDPKLAPPIMKEMLK